jgi:HSP20 family molecular chaperone IbpA
MVQFPVFEVSPLHYVSHGPHRRSSCTRRDSFWPSSMCQQHQSHRLLPTVSASTAPELFNWDMKPLASTQEVTNDRVNICLPLDGFDEKDLSITLDNGMLKIVAEKEEKNERGQVVTAKKITKMMTLPQNCNTQHLEKAVVGDGTLKIIIPRSQEANGEQNNEEQDPETDETKLVLATLPVRGYQPKDIKVQVVRNVNTLEVSGRHEDKSEDGHMTSVIQFSNTFLLPKHINVESIRSSISTKGNQLKITAPVTKPAPAVSEEPRNIPIQIDTGKA